MKRVYLVQKPPLKFHVEIRSSVTGQTSAVKKSPAKLVTQYYAVIKARNNEIVFVGEMRTRKSGIIKTCKNLFGEGIKIIDKTK